jgi:8-oxo-dGTP diphosphatase
MANLPTKRMAAGVLILDSNHQILIVKPTYRQAWLIPGGVIEADESPRRACRREVYEELGLELELGPLLCLEYRSSAPPRTECLQFIFAGGVLSTTQIEHIKLPATELAGYCFVSLDEALEKLDARLGRRIDLALTALHQGRMIYAEDRNEIGTKYGQ